MTTISEILYDKLQDNSSYLFKNGSFAKLIFNKPKKMIRFKLKQTNSNNINYNNKFLFEHSYLNKKNIQIIGDQKEVNTEDNFYNLIGTSLENLKLKTGNLVGTISDGKIVLKISSRFGDNFLKYIIAYSHGFLELENLGSQNQDASNNNWMLYFLWQTKLLKVANNPGLPKAYVGRNERLRKPRGRIDIVDYVMKTNPETFKCSYREMSSQTKAMALVLHAYKLVNKNTIIQSFSKLQSNFHKLGIELEQALSGYNVPLKDLMKIPDKELYNNNPMYKGFNEVVTLSKKVIKSFGANASHNNDSSTFLFDVSMLFEYFISKTLKYNGFILENKQMSKISNGVIHNARGLEPDIIIKHNDGSRSIFDVKYKNFNTNFNKGAKREDLFQLHTYVGQALNISEVKACGFIYPLHPDDENQELIFKSEIKISEKTIPFYIIRLPIPNNIDNNTMKQFTKEMKTNIKKFLKEMENIIEQ